MRVPKRDLVATGLVAAAGIVYLLWAVGWSLPGMSGVRVTGVAILALGFAASASAVVPGFDGLLHGSKVYLTVTSMIGLVALVGGVVMLVAGSSGAMAMVMAAMGVLWLVATVHHGLLARTRTLPPSGTQPPSLVTTYPAA